MNNLCPLVLTSMVCYRYLTLKNISMIGDFLNSLAYLGLTADKMVPLLLVTGFALYFVNKSLAPIKKSIAQITNACIEIQTIFGIHGIDLKHCLVETSGSPLKLTKYGAQLIKDSGLEKILNDNKETLCDQLKARLKEGYTEYDVQENARNILVGLKDDSIMKPVKEYVYNHPMDITIILRAGGLWLRDDFLKKPRETADE